MQNLKTLIFLILVIFVMSKSKTSSKLKNKNPEHEMFDVNRNNNEDHTRNFEAMNNYGFNHENDHSEGNTGPFGNGEHGGDNEFFGGDHEFFGGDHENNDFGTGEHEGNHNFFGGDHENHEFGNGEHDGYGNFFGNNTNDNGTYFNDHHNNHHPSLFDTFTSQLYEFVSHWGYVFNHLERELDAVREQPRPEHEGLYDQDFGGFNHQDNGDFEHQNFPETVNENQNFNEYGTTGENLSYKKMKNMKKNVKQNKGR